MEESAGWLKNHRDTLTSAISRVSDQSFRHLEHEIGRRDQERQSLLEHITRLVTEQAQLREENSQLSLENSCLKSQITVAIQVNNVPSLSPNSEAEGCEARIEDSTNGKNGPVMNEAGTVPYGDFANLTTKYETLRLQHAETQRALSKSIKNNQYSTEKYREMKEQVKVWQRYIDRKLAKESSSRPNTTTTLGASSTVGAFGADFKPTRTSAHLKDSITGRRLSASISPKIGPADSNVPQLPVSLNATEQLPPSHGAGEHPPCMGRSPLHSIPLSQQNNTTVPESLSQDSEFNDRPSVYDLIDREVVPNMQLPKDHGTSAVAQETSGVVEVPPASAPTSERMLSSQATEYDMNTQEVSQVNPPAATADDDNDVPEFVSARSLKRKRHIPHAFEVYDDNRASDGTPISPIMVKEEASRSSPDTARPTLKVHRNETLDLDAPTTIATPRKVKSHEYVCKMQSTLSVASAGIRQERRSRMPVIKDEPLEESEPRNGFNESTAVLVSSKHDPDMNMEEIANNEPASLQKMPSDDSPADMLHPLDSNIRMIPEAGEPPNRAKRRRRDMDEIIRKAHTRSKNGESSSGGESSIETKSKRFPPVIKLEADRDIQSVIDGPTPEKQNHLTSITPAPGKLKRPAKNTPSQNPTPLATTRNDRPTRIKGQEYGAPTSKTALAYIAQKSSSRPGSCSSFTTLRSRPLESISIDDLKPNPVYNQGLDYTFVDAVRGREARKCVPGCTKPECCGGVFRALAASAPDMTAPRRLFNSSDDDSDSEDTRLVKDYLGNAYDTAKVRRMPREEREELVLQARTRLLADRHGKHKHAYERRATPPGFWRTDFPTTQEVEKDRDRKSVV